MEDSTTAPDLLRGLPAVALHLGITLRQAKHWQVREILPTFMLGGLVCARKSTLNAWLAAAEQQAMARRAEGNAA